MTDDLGVYRDAIWVLQAVRGAENAEIQQFLDVLVRRVQAAATFGNHWTRNAPEYGSTAPAKFPVRHPVRTLPSMDDQTFNVSKFYVKPIVCHHGFGRIQIDAWYVR